jgi:hypothetical protein
MKYKQATKIVVKKFRDNLPPFKHIIIEFTDNGRFAIIKKGEMVCEGSLLEYLTMIEGYTRESEIRYIQSQYAEALKGER